MGKVSSPQWKSRRALPGHIATGLMALVTTLWTFWGVVEMYYEGWWGHGIHVCPIRCRARYVRA